MIKIGVTGGIGSGKSIICSVLEHMGYPVFYSDIEAKKIINSNAEVKYQLIDLFGSQVFIDNQLNRTYLATILFSDSTLVEKMNAIVHPKVRQSFQEWALKQNSTIVFNEAAILFETGAFKNFEATLLVTAPLTIRLKRVISRDGSSEEEVMKRIAHQWPDEQKKDLATFTLVNDDNQSVLNQLDNILSEIQALV